MSKDRTVLAVQLVLLCKLSCEVALLRVVFVVVEVGDMLFGLLSEFVVDGEDLLEIVMRRKGSVHWLLACLYLRCAVA